MALTYSFNTATHPYAVSGDIFITSGTLTVATGDYIDIIAVFADNADSLTWTVTNTGTAITWGAAKQDTNTAANCRVVHWSGVAGATPPTTVTVSSTSGAQVYGSKVLYTIVHTGQHATDPLPAGHLYSITSGTDRSQAITPTSAGSNLWMVLGDWGATDTMAAGTNCTLEVARYHETDYQDVVIVRPTTQPRTDTNSFTLAEADTGGKVIGIAFEVQAAAVATAALTGTATASITEADVVTGGKTIILTLTGDTYVAAGTGPIGSIANTTDLINGIDSGQAEATGWDTVVKADLITNLATAVVRTSATVCTITLPASATYNITAQETITATIPAAVLTLAAPIVASPTFTVDIVAAGAKSYYYQANQ